MCGIAGFSLGARADLDPTALGRMLLAGIAERGADASGVAWAVEGHGDARIEKTIGGATALIPRLSLPPRVTSALLHVRDFTKGEPHIEANNHPIRHGHVVGIHNGRILNDEELLAEHGLRRARPEATVDSEALFALLDLRADDPGDALGRVRGPVAASWLDRRRPGVLFLARGRARPLVVAFAARLDVAVFASTDGALELVRRAGVPLGEAIAVREGSCVELAAGVERHRFAFTPQPFVERRTTRPAPSPLERLRALRLVADPGGWAGA